MEGASHGACLSAPCRPAFALLLPCWPATCLDFVERVAVEDQSIGRAKSRRRTSSFLSGRSRATPTLRGWRSVGAFLPSASLPCTTKPGHAGTGHCPPDDVKGLWAGLVSIPLDLFKMEKVIDEICSRQKELEKTEEQGIFSGDSSR